MTRADPPGGCGWATVAAAIGVKIRPGTTTKPALAGVILWPTAQAVGKEESAGFQAPPGAASCAGIMSPPTGLK